MVDINRTLSYIDSILMMRVGATILFLSALALVIRYLRSQRKRVLDTFDTRIKRVGLLFIIIGTIIVDFTSIAIVWGVSDTVIDTVTSKVKGNVVVKTLTTIIVLILTYLSTGVLDSATSRIFTEDGTQVVDEHRREVIFRVSQITMYLLVGIAVFEYWDVDIGSVLIGAGALAAIIGLSARHTLNSVLAGTVLLFSRPFKVGDWISVDDEEGTVKRITIVNTILKTPDDEEVVIPNDVISEQKISNKSKSNKVRLSVDVGVPYTCDVDEATRIIESAVKQCQIVTEIPECSARVVSFEDSSVLIRAQFWIREPSPRRRTTSKSMVRKYIKKSLESEDIHIPYPQREVNVETDERRKFKSEAIKEENSKENNSDEKPKPADIKTK